MERFGAAATRTVQAEPGWCDAAGDGRDRHARRDAGAVSGADGGRRGGGPGGGGDGGGGLCVGECRGRGAVAARHVAVEGDPAGTSGARGGALAVDPGGGSYRERYPAVEPGPGGPGGGDRPGAPRERGDHRAIAGPFAAAAGRWGRLAQQCGGAGGVRRGDGGGVAPSRFARGDRPGVRGRYRTDRRCGSGGARTAGGPGDGDPPRPAAAGRHGGAAGIVGPVTRAGGGADPIGFRDQCEPRVAHAIGQRSSGFSASWPSRRRGCIG